MTTITQTHTQLPTGTSNVDLVHSQVGFSLEYMSSASTGICSSRAASPRSPAT